MNPDNLRIPPHSIEAEQAVIGGILLDNKAYLRIANLLIDSDFYRDDHQLIYRALADMATDQQPFDVVTVSEWMKGRFLDNGYEKRSFFDIIGGLSYLGDLAKDTPSSANIIAYATIVRHYSIRRQTLAFATQLTEKAFKKSSDEDEISALLDYAVTGAFELDRAQKNSQQKGFIAVKEALNQHLESLQHLAKSNGKSLLGAASTLKKLDKQLSGFEQGKIYVLAGRPAMGKTTLGLNLVEGIAHSTGGVVAVFSLEMSTDQIISKMMASQGRIDFDHLRNPWKLSKTEWQSIAHGVTKISGMELFIDDAAEQSPTTIRTRCYQLLQQTGKPLTAILVDYVQLMHGSRQQYPNREAEVAAISGGLRALAKDFSCPVIVLSQLNRALENRPDKRPILSDLRESGALEQDASCVIFIYRDEVYKKRSRDKGIAELIIAKHRGGKTGTIRCAFIGEHQRFGNLSESNEKSNNKTAKKTTSRKQHNNNSNNNTTYQPCQPYPTVAKEIY